jgi:hypothetical protein
MQDIGTESIGQHTPFASGPASGLGGRGEGEGEGVEGDGALECVESGVSSSEAEHAAIAKRGRKRTMRSRRMLAR